MRQILPAVWAVLLGATLLVLGNGLLGTLLGVRLTQAGQPPLVTGVVMAAFYLGLVVGALRGHRLIQGVGHIRMFAAMASLYSAATLVHGLVALPAAWAALRLVEGFCLAGLYLCVESWLNEKVSNVTRGAVLSLYMVLMQGGMASSQFLLLLAEPAAFTLLAVSSILVSVSLVPMTMARIPAPALPPPTLFTFRELMSISPLGVVGCLVAGTVAGAFYGVGPVYAAAVGFETGSIAWFMAVTIFGGLLSQAPLGHLSDRLDRRKLMAGLFLATALLCLPLIWADRHGALLLMGGMALFGAVALPLYALAVAHANDFLDPEDVVPAAGGLILAYSVGATTGPLLATAAMARLGPDGLFWFVATVSLLAAAFAIMRITSQPAVPAEDRTAFHVIAQSTYLASELDPRAESGQLSFDFDAPAGPEE